MKTTLCEPKLGIEVREFGVVDIPDDIFFELRQLVIDSGIDEPFDYNSNLKYMLWKEGELAGAIAYRIVITEAGNYIPRFIHVILSPKIQRSKIAYKFVKDSLKDLRKKGFVQAIAVILDRRNMMIRLAKKLGFKEYKTDKVREERYYYLNLKEVK